MKELPSFDLTDEYLRWSQAQRELYERLHKLVDDALLQEFAKYTWPDDRSEMQVFIAIILARNYEARGN